MDLERISLWILEEKEKVEEKSVFHFHLLVEIDGGVW